MPTLRLTALCLLAAAYGFADPNAPKAAPSTPAAAPSTPAAAPTAPSTQLDTVTVTGWGEGIPSLPGSATYIDGATFRDKGQVNLTNIAQNVPGVNIRDEDGYGNFPNLSIRGVDGTRSSKVTLMEDGILAAPSPYAAPNAYYTPKAGRMAGIEFIKGSSQVRFGPHTTGGVVNFLSTPLPTDNTNTGYLRLTYGSHNTNFMQVWAGSVEALGDGQIATLVELHAQATDGYRTIDGSSANTGYHLLEPMIKLGWQPDKNRAHRFEFKVGMTDLDADESYVGITEADLRANPDRRYAASAFDKLVAEHLRTSLKWSAQPDALTRVESTLYFNTFERTWDKLDGLTNVGPSTPTNLGQALMNPTAVGVLKGLSAGSTVNRSAYRDHESMGWQTEARLKSKGTVDHEVTLGLRLHRDTATGTNQSFVRASNQMGGFSNPVAGAVTSAGEAEAEAVSLYVEDAMRFGALTIRPGVRQEWISYANRGSSTPANNGEGDTTLTTGGIGATLDLTPKTSVFTGVFAGASPANPSGFLSGAQAERSLGSELGLRHSDKGLRWEVALFHTDFSRLIAPEVGVSAGGLSPSKNAGEAQAYGVEASVTYDHGRAQGWSIGTPVSLSATFTHAEFKDLSSRLSNSAGLFAGAENGSEIPYIPEWKIGLSAGVETEKTAVTLDIGYNSATWGTGYNERPRLTDLGAPDAPSAIDGRVAALATADLSFRYNIQSGFRFIGGVHNLTDEREIISRAPLGPRANAPRTFHLGIEARF